MAKSLHGKETTFSKSFKGVSWKTVFRLSNNRNLGVSVMYKDAGFTLQLKQILADRH